MSAKHFADLVLAAPDPLRSLDYVRRDLGVCKSTFQRHVRHSLPIVRISERRLGVRQSDLDAWKAARTSRPAG